MIDPTNITKFDRNEAELEEFLLFCILVAGKNSNVQAKKLEQFLNYSARRMYPFAILRYLLLNDGSLLSWMGMCRLGQYTRLLKCFTQLVSLQGKLDTCTVSDLEAIHGLGRKTSRFFLMHSRPNQNFGVLDTHVLKWLNAHGVSAPKSTPSSDKQYQ